MIVALTFVLTLLVPYLVLMSWLLFGMLRRSAAPRTASAQAWPSVDLIVPARDEEAGLPATLASLRQLRYPGRLRIIVVDDRSTDATAATVERATRVDPRLRLVRVRSASRRWAPKVNAVRHGLRSGDGAVVMTTDADCRLPSGWVTAMAAPFADPQVVMVLGAVTTHDTGEATGFRDRYEAIDWLALMLVSRSLARLGLTVASSANAQAYRRASFDRVGGFGAAARAPSGDEDLLAQRLGRLPGARTVFLDAASARVFTRPARSWRALLTQRWRWVSRYRHVEAYHPLFWSAIALLGGLAAALVATLLVLPWAPWAAHAVAMAWATKIGVDTLAIHLGLARLGRRDLRGIGVVGWAVVHPFFTTGTLVASLLRSGSWGAGRSASPRRAPARSRPSPRGAKSRPGATRRLNHRW